MVEKGIRGRICQFIIRYGKSSKYIKDYHKSKESSYLKYWHVNNLYEWAMLHKLNGFKMVEDLSEFHEGFIKIFNEKSTVQYSLELDIQYLEELHKPYAILAILGLIIFTWKNGNWKFKKLGADLHDKSQFVIHIRNLHQTLNLELVLKIVHRIIKFNKKAC